MSVICFASLKGGVGKTSLSINVSHAFAKRGCESLLIDCDPIAHTSRFFQDVGLGVPHSPLAELFVPMDSRRPERSTGDLIDLAISSGLSMIVPVRPGLAVLPAGAELRYFLWGRGARCFKSLFPQLIQELRGSYDHIVIDTPPDFHVLTRSAIAVSDLVVVPVDASQMSIFCLEEIVQSAAHIKGPTWAIIRAMVTRQALSLHRLRETRLEQNLDLRRHELRSEEEGQDSFEEVNLENPEDFIAMVQQHELTKGRALASVGSAKRSPVSGKSSRNDSPIYLLNSIIYRTEQQNRLSFLGKTAQDARATSKLGDQYLNVARELEEILTLSTVKRQARPSGGDNLRNSCMYVM